MYSLPKNTRVLLTTLDMYFYFEHKIYDVRCLCLKLLKMAVLESPFKKIGIENTNYMRTTIDAN